MNTSLEKIAKTLALILLAIIISCSLIGTKQNTQNAKTGPPVIVQIKNQPGDSLVSTVSVCPLQLQKLCGAYDTIQNRYIKRFTDEELTNIFISGAEKKMGILSIKPAPFDCPKHQQKLCDAYYSFQNKNGKRISDNALTETFIHGAVNMLKENDPYSKYMPLGEEDSPFAHYSGIGIITDKDEDLFSSLVVRQVIPGSPASQANIKRGDRITHINGISVSGKTQKESTDLIRGRNGTQVQLTVIQGCSHKTRHILIARKNITDNDSGVVHRIEGNYGYVRIANFLGNPAGKVRFFLKQSQNNHVPLKGLIIDLRENPGGSVMQAVQFVGLFKEKGIVLFEQGQDGRDIPWKIPEENHEILPDIPIVVLINHDSASASEITAGALKDFKRATIMGTTTYGKGVMQTTIYLKDRSTLYLTIAHTFTPNHTAIHKIGIPPDITVKEGDNESCTGDEQLAAAIHFLKEERF